ncbi:MAG: hypothetical protein EOO10_21160, partial [Chitinophagaceae bacterium]
MKKIILGSSVLLLLLAGFSFQPVKEWQSKFVQQTKNGSLKYTPDEKGNIIPDFSRVGYYHGDKEIPTITVVKTVQASPTAEQDIQSAINEVAKMPLDKNGFRGTVLLKNGTYTINGSITINVSGIVLRGEGDGTKLIAAGTAKRALIKVAGKGAIKELEGSRTKITDDYVPVGTFSFNVA